MNTSNYIRYVTLPFNASYNCRRATLLHCVSKKRYSCCRLYLQRTSTDFGSFWQRCRWESMLLNGDFVIPPLLTNVSAPPGETCGVSGAFLRIFVHMKIARLLFSLRQITRKKYTQIRFLQMWRWSVECYWHCSDETVHYKSDETVNFCGFRCATTSPVTVFINFVFYINTLNVWNLAYCHCSCSKPGH